ncbi:MAG: glycosyltransferase family 39 protein [Deltaproteobacteria bacterium]|nr:glycosyltransferase family 39 protein [Deltaproteobacteria bacterium]
MGIFGLALSIAVFFVAGAALGALLGLPLRMRLLTAYPLGVSAVTLQMFFYSLTGIPFGFFAISVPWFAVFVVVSAFKSTARDNETPCKSQGRLGAFEFFLIFVIVIQAVFSAANSVSLPVQGFDAWVIWFMKAKVFFADRTVGHDFFLNTVYSNGNPGTYTYPLTIPLAVAFSWTTMGYADDQAVKFIFVLFYWCMLGSFYCFSREIISRKTALILTAMLATVPRVMEQGGLTGVGYADLPLAVYFLCAAGFGLAYMRSRTRRDYLLAVLFLTFGANVKNEGLTFLLAAFALISGYAVFKDKKIGARGVFYGLLLCAVVVLPWLAFKAALPRLSESLVSDFSAAAVFSNLDRLPFIVKTIVPKLFTANKYHISWALYAVGTLVSYRSLRKNGEYAFVQALLWIQFSFYILVYLVTPLELKSNIDTSFDRLTIQLLPLVYLSIAFGWRAFFNASGAGRDGLAPETER